MKILELTTRKLVAVIEFLSPTNKRGLERKKYLRKRERILLSSVHLLEIDLLRKGKRCQCARRCRPRTTMYY